MIDVVELVPAPRPAFSVSEHHAIKLNAFSDLRPWRDALKDYLNPPGKPRQRIKAWRTKL
ncbi:hypothetical protein DOT_5950 [Desulfosporosinus sp. OT]|nr:hypothetical protein DOT_5950 [Desulfosporosinus sp. OT]